MKSAQTRSSSPHRNMIPEILTKYESELLAEWVREQKASGIREELISEIELRAQSMEFLKLFGDAIRTGDDFQLQQREWAAVRELLESLSRDRGIKGFTPSETAS